MKTKTAKETELVKAAIESAVKDKAGRINQLEVKLDTLLDGATSHPEIREAMPKCKDFFKSLTSDEFVRLLDGKSNTDPVYIALWYHYSDIMHKAIDNCALAYK